MFGQNPPEIFPDLWVEWAPSRRFVEMVRHPRAELRQAPMEFMRDSDHCKVGFFAAAGPGIAARGAQADVSVLDVAPTLLRLLNVPVPPELTGRPLTTWLASSVQDTAIS
jgi:predicted AlkP superfamily phosphohydrolase/phosphomutase